MNTTSNSPVQLAFDYVEFTGQHVFLTGKAGTGKTTFLHDLKRRSPKRMIVVAPTGVAAINAGGVTIHSFFQLPFGPLVPQTDPAETYSIASPQGAGKRVHRFSRNKINIIKSLDLLVIDEISMVRADLLDGIDAVLRRFKSRNKPFGGVQLLMIGDLQQLAPVAKEEEWGLLSPYYKTPFFFSSRALGETDLITVELKHIYRQSDPVFIEVLNKVRENDLDSETLAALNKRYLPEHTRLRMNGYITLTTHNHQADAINRERLNTLRAAQTVFPASIEGDFPAYSYPTEAQLVLKKGAQVMFVKNDSSKDKLYYNGKTGTVTDIDKTAVTVHCAGDDRSITVVPVVWQNTRYELDDATKEIKEAVIGSFTQYPLKLAWAITIHKSQGLTFEKAIIDANAAFAHGQVYVALSRCRTLEGLVLSSPLALRSVKNDPAVSAFVQTAQHKAADEERLRNSKAAYQQALLEELFDFSPMLKGLFYCRKLAREHVASLRPGLHEELDAIIAIVKNEMTDIAGKFIRQLRQICLQQDLAEQNMLLQERVRKACGYFSEKIEPVAVRAWGILSVDTDNKTVSKVLEHAVRQLREVVEVKTRCLKANRGGFSVKRYLEAKSMAMIDEPEKKSRVRAAKTECVSGDSPHPELLQSLKSWRFKKAGELDVPAYMVLQLKPLQAVAAHLPSTITALSGISGIGARKLEKFGDEIISIVQAYCDEIGGGADRAFETVDRPA